VLIAAIVKAFLQSAQRQLAPKRRRRRYTSYFGRRAPARRKRKRIVGLDDVFKEILGGRR
jgi:predicted amidophosphoribosyltransferase